MRDNSLRARPRDRLAWKYLRTACANLQEVIAAGVQAYFEEYLSETERLLVDDDQRGLYKHLKTTIEGWKGDKRGVRSLPVSGTRRVRDEGGTLLRDKVRIR